MENTTGSPNTPPRWARRLLTWGCPSHLLEEVEGDMLEDYQYHLRKHGKRKADREYMINVVGFMSPFSRRKHDQYSPSLFSTIMWKNYFITAMRNIARNRTYSLINLAGLTFGLASSMLIFQYVIYENSADGFHEKVDRLYRVAFRIVSSGGTPNVRSQIHLGAGEAFKEEIPAVKNFARIRADFFQEGATISYIHNGENKTFKDIRSILVDSTFLNVFSFQMAKGNRATALSQPQSILLSESTARRLFDNDDPMGKRIDYGMNQGTLTFQVTGILKDTPANSHIQFDVIIPLEVYLSNIPTNQRQYFNPWRTDEYTTYVELAPDADISEVESAMGTIVNRHLGEQLKEGNTTLSVELQPMRSVYFDRETDLGMLGFGSAIVATRTGNEQMVYFLTVIAIITLIIALMSYVNLSTIRSLDRAKEVGVRKVIGAFKHNLRLQFFMESTMMNLAGLISAIILVILLVPSFNEFVQTDFTLESWFNTKFLMLIGGIFVVGVLLSGLYPAFVLSSFMPITVLKGNTGNIGSRSRLRKFLVVLQYAPAISLLVCTFVVYLQVDYMRNMDVGLDMHRLITVRSARILPDTVPSRVAEAALKKEVVKIPGIEYASFAGNQAGRGLNFYVLFQTDSVGDGSVKKLKCTGVDHDFASAFRLKLVAGQDFTEGMSPTHGNPDDFIRKVLVNETAVKTWGFKRNEDVVGRIVRGQEGGRFYILGVLEDFNWASVHQATDPVMFWYTPNNRFMTIRTQPDADLNKVIAEVKDVYTQLFPNDVFHYEFADDVFKRQYGEDEKFAKLFGIFSGLACLIASMGLFGLAAFSAKRRTKEVGIRKVMGASVNNIVALLGREFVLLVLIAFVIASPIAWFVMAEWLQTFAFHIPLNVVPFAITGVGALLIAIVTVSWRTILVAKANPINSLRDE
jgi:putative ABC transport system permease protein